MRRKSPEQLEQRIGTTRTIKMKLKMPLLFFKDALIAFPRVQISFVLIKGQENGFVKDESLNYTPHP